MAKFSFKLEKVMQHRKTLEDVAQRDFEEASFSLRALENQKLEFERSIHSARVEASRLLSMGGNPGPALSQIDVFIKGQEIRIQRQNDKIKEQETLVENLREILRQRAIEYKIMEELKDKKKREFKEEEGKKEQKEVDDLNSMRSAMRHQRGN